MDPITVLLIVLLVCALGGWGAGWPARNGPWPATPLTLVLVVVVVLLVLRLR